MLNILTSFVWHRVVLRIIVSLLLVGLLVSPEDADAQRKKVGVVLSGGGAKGVAHIGVLQMLERAGIPVDVIVGTSMGAIVGGLYAIGYTADQLDSLVRGQDWMFLLGDKTNRQYLSFAEKENDDKYILSLPFNNYKRPPAGFIGGQNVYRLLTDLTIGYHDSLDFTQLPISFACVTADMFHREEVVLREGNLAQAMRASMAVPGVFTPVHVGNRVLVDGGIMNNFPADVARAMGAEVIIGVDVQSELVAEEKLESVAGVLPQIIHLLCLNKHEENVKLADLMIRPNMTGYTAASFSARSIDSLLFRGRDAALREWEGLVRLKEVIGVGTREEGCQLRHREIGAIVIRHILIRGVSPGEEVRVRRGMHLREYSMVTLGEIHREIARLYGTRSFSAVSYRLLGVSPRDLELDLKVQPVSVVNLGFRFDTEEMATILLNTTLGYKALSGSRMSLTARLGQNPYVKLEYALENTFLRRFNLSYRFGFNNVDYYVRGKKTNSVTYRYHAGELGMSSLYFQNFKFQVGMRYEFFDYNSLLFMDGQERVKVRPEGMFSYYGLARIETYDRLFYPTRGVLFSASYAVYTDNLATYDGKAPFSALALTISPVISLSNRLKLTPALYGRVLIGSNPAYSQLNCMGGTVPGRYTLQQLPFLGINHVEVFDRSLVVGKIEFRQRVGRKHYLLTVGNYALQNDHFFDMSKHAGIWGGGIGYSRDSQLGPIEALFSFSNWSEKLEFYFNFGFNF